MSKKALWAQCLIFLAFIFGLFVLNIISEDREFSEQENRFLQAMPKFSFDSLKSGDFTSDYETYITDQFVFRDSFTAVKAGSELLSGKKENNGVFLCENETLIEAFDSEGTNNIETAINAVNKLAENAEVPVYFALIPSKSEIWRDMLPHGVENDEQKEYIESIYSQIKANTVDMYSPLYENRDEDIFYRTDHHWTTLGAYYGYCAVMNAMGIESTPLSFYNEKTVSDSFYGTTYSSSGYSWIKPDSMVTYVEQGETEIINYPNGTPEEGSLYVDSYLDAKDKYSYFFGGNTPLLQISTENTDAPSLLIIRDSYMDSMSPFMFENFSRIHIIDLRYYRASISQYIKDNSIDNVLVCYNTVNFSTDMNLFLMGY